MSDTPISTRYGVAIGLVYGKEIYLSRRTETVVAFPKKWQFINGRMHGTEQSKTAAIRLVEQQAGIFLEENRLHPMPHIEIPNSGEFYYVYFVHLTENEKPATDDINERCRGPWKQFPIEKAAILDVVTGIRPILRNLQAALKRVESENLRNKVLSTSTAEEISSQMADQVAFQYGVD